jgi:alanine-alpha-ketoisovalerate/valine-pyruvate aminotransferase
MERPDYLKRKVIRPFYSKKVISLVRIIKQKEI